MSGAFLSPILSMIFALQASPSPALQHLHAGLEAEKNGQLDAAVAELQKATESIPS